jgi:hypothetical protein
MTDDNEQSIPSLGSQPEAWANEDDDGIYEVGLSEANADYVCERAANGKYSHRNPRIVPLYRQPQPTLTDLQRAAIAYGVLLCDATAGMANDRATIDGASSAADVLRGLLERKE